MTPQWTTEADVLRVLRRRWDSGAALSAYARGRPWTPLPVPVKAPTAAELSENFGAAQAWASAWAAAASSLRIEHKSIGGRIVGVNRVPARVWVDSYDRMWRLLGVGRDVRRFDALADETCRLEPSLLGWMVDHPIKVLGLSEVWYQLVAVVGWIAQHQTSGVYVRQIDVSGVDTKFVETHRGVLTDLLDRRLTAARIDRSVPRSDFAGRYGLQKKPTYVRIRSLGAGGLPEPYTEVALRVAELAATPVPVTSVYVVENEITYLAFPAIPRAVVVLGEGYAVPRLQPVHWLRDRDVVYWGDIDTHGFRILDQLRRHFPRVRSLLMDRRTLFAHERQWVVEPSPVAEPLDRLTADEAALYRDLVEDTFGPSVRLEQERVSYSAIEAALGR